MRKEAIRTRRLILLLMPGFLLILNLFLVSSGTITRSFSSNLVVNGSLLNVSLNVTANSFDKFYVIEEFIPAAWSFFNIGGGNKRHQGFFIAHTFSHVTVDINMITHRIAI